MTLYRLPDYVDHMLEAAELACSYIEGMPKEDFLDDKRTQQAVVLNLIVIGEVATKILKDHPDFAGEHTTVPWSSMKGMRNRIAHGYYGNLAQWRALFIPFIPALFTAHRPNQTWYDLSSAFPCLTHTQGCFLPNHSRWRACKRLDKKSAIARALSDW